MCARVPPEESRVAPGRNEVLMLSEQTQSLMARYGVTTRDALLRAVRDEMNTECWQPGDGPRFTIRDAELSLGPMLEAEYQRIAGGAYDEPVDEPDYVEMTYERWQSDYGVEPDPEPTT